MGLARDTKDIGNIVVASNNGAPVRVSDIGDVVIGHAPRLGEFGFNKNDDAVEGVILMRRGEQAQNVLKGVEAKTKELNEQVLPKDVKINAYYDRSDLVQLTIDTVEGNLLRGMILVLIVLIFFLVSVRAAVITALTIPLALLFAFIILHARNISANLLSIGAIDFGILIDGTVVMMENIYRELGLRHGQHYKLHEVIAAAASDVDRPIFYSVAVIIAGYLPIYVLHGPFRHALPSHGRYHVVRADWRPGSDLDSGSGAGLLLVQKRRARKARTAPMSGSRTSMEANSVGASDHPKLSMLVAVLIFGATLLLVPTIGGEFMPHLDEGALWVRATMPYTISFEESAKIAPQIRDDLDVLSRK